MTTFSRNDECSRSLLLLLPSSVAVAVELLLPFAAAIGVVVLGPNQTYCSHGKSSNRDKRTMTDMYDKAEPFDGKLDPYPHNERGVEVSALCYVQPQSYLFPVVAG